MSRQPPDQTGNDANSTDMPAAIRLDKWLWHCRLVKTRTLAARLISAGKLRVNEVRVRKPATLVRPGDWITAALHNQIKVIQMLAPGTRRGPASEAQTLYRSLADAAEPDQESDAAKSDQGQRPDHNEAGQNGPSAPATTARATEEAPTTPPSASPRPGRAQRVGRRPTKKARRQLEKWRDL